MSHRYPKWLYSAQGPQLVQTEAHHAALGAGWSETEVPLTAPQHDAAATTRDDEAADEADPDNPVAVVAATKAGGSKKKPAAPPAQA